MPIEEQKACHAVRSHGYGYCGRFVSFENLEGKVRGEIWMAEDVPVRGCFCSGW